MISKIKWITSLSEDNLW